MRSRAPSIQNASIPCEYAWPRSHFARFGDATKPSRASCDLGSISAFHELGITPRTCPIRTSRSGEGVDCDGTGRMDISLEEGAWAIGVRVQAVASAATE